MGKHTLPTLLLLSLILFNVSDASFDLGFRKLGALDPQDNKTAPKGSPLPTQKKPDPNPVGETKKEEKLPSTNDDIAKSKDPEGSKSNNDTQSPAPTPLPKVEKEKDQQKEPKNAAPPTVVEKESGNSHEEEKKEKEKENEGKTFPHSTTSETCDGLNKCRDEGGMVACISEIDPEYVIVLIQNGGDGIIKVKLKESNIENVEVGKHQTEKINVSLISSETPRLTLNAGKGDCMLHMGALVPKGSLFVHLPSYDKILTPINGAYFLILTVLVFGVTFACCKLRKKQHDGVPYQELEMALPESVAATTNVESAEGWDQVWDDDWDDDVAVKSPAVHAGSISANGLTSRSSNKDGWEDNWDD